MGKLLFRHRSTGFTPLKNLINNLALFFLDLFTVMERERVIALVRRLELMRLSAHASLPPCAAGVLPPERV